MVTKDTTEQVLWMADCYSLAKRFPNPHTWLALLEPVETVDVEKLNPFHYWLWMEIWKAAQLTDSGDVQKTAAVKVTAKPKLAAQQAAKCRS